jgi:hypothetical protein
MWGMSRPLITEPIERHCCECGSMARLVRTRRGDSICGRCLADLRLASAKAFVAPQDVEKVLGQHRLF